jgi:hypothetical protein
VLLPSTNALPASNTPSTAAAQRSKKSCPAAVSVSLRVDRCIKRVSNAVSSCRMRRLKVFGGTASLRAASAKLRARTTCTNMRTCGRG